MLTVRATVAPPNSLVYFEGCGKVELPKVDGRELISATMDSIAIGTLSSADGETTVTLTDDASLTEGLRREFQGRIDLHGQELRVVSVEGATYLRATTDLRTPAVSIYTDDPSEPSRIVINVEASLSPA